MRRYIVTLTVDLEDEWSGFYSPREFDWEGMVNCDDSYHDTGLDDVPPSGNERAKVQIIGCGRVEP